MLFSTRTSLRVPPLEQEFLILLEQVSSNSFFTGVRVAQSLVFCIISTIVCHFILFLLAIILCVLGIIPSLQTFLSNLIIQKRRRDLTIRATNFDWQWFFRRFSIFFQSDVMPTILILEEAHSGSITTDYLGQRLAKFTWSFNFGKQS